MANKKLDILVTGATGLAGAEAVRQALLCTDVGQVTAIARKPLDITHPKLTTIIHYNFLDYSALDEVFKQADACLWCLGISQTQVSKQQYINITCNYTLAAAKAMLAANPAIGFVFLSCIGADSAEKSSILFARVKGQTENALQKLPFQKLYIARPGGIMPVHKKPHPTLAEKMMIPLFPLIKKFAPASVITSAQLAKAMLHMAAYGSDKVIHNNNDLISMLGVQEEPAA